MRFITTVSLLFVLLITSRCEKQKYSKILLANQNGATYVTTWIVPTDSNSTIYSNTYYVSPSGLDINNGSSISLAFQTIKQELIQAESGDIILNFVPEPNYD